MGGFVYVIEAEGGPVKVGIATDPSKRLLKLKTGVPFPLRLAHAEAIEDGLNIRLVEKTAHRILKPHCTYGEWFKVSSDEALAAIQTALERLRAEPIEPLRAPTVDPQPWAIMTAAQSRAARGLLSWTQAQVAAAANVSQATVRNFECGRGTLIRITRNAVQRAFEVEGIEFLDDDGVKLRRRGTLLSDE